MGKAGDFPERSAPELGPEACMMALWAVAAHSPKAPVPRKPPNHPTALWPLLFGTQHSRAKSSEGWKLVFSLCIGASAGTQQETEQLGWGAAWVVPSEVQRHTAGLTPVVHPYQ